MVTTDAFPVKPEELTAEWLTRVMRESGVLARDGRVAGFSAEAMGFENGMVGNLVRLTLAYAPQDATASIATGRRGKRWWRTARTPESVSACS